MDAPGQLCSRARFWASLRVDGELSELEGALLDAHLGRCDACREVVAGFAVATDRLRAEPLARPKPVVVSVARASRRMLASVAVAVVVIAGAVLGGLVRGNAAPSTASLPRVVAVVASVETPDQLRRLRRTTLLNQRRIPRDMAAEPV
jgi:anti-sigma factor RsiW